MLYQTSPRSLNEQKIYRNQQQQYNNKKIKQTLQFNFHIIGHHLRGWTQQNNLRIQPEMPHLRGWRNLRQHPSPFCNNTVNYKKTRGSKIHQNTFTRSIRNNDDCTPSLPSNGYNRMHDGIAMAPISVIKRSKTWWHHITSNYTKTIYTAPMEEKKPSTRYYKEAIDTYGRRD